jgi:hypothetical protein
MRSGFSGYGAWILTGFSSKRRGGHRGAHLGQQIGRQAAGVARSGGRLPRAWALTAARYGGPPAPRGRRGASQRGPQPPANLQLRQATVEDGV